MEMAIGVMFLMIAFTIMLLSTAGLQNRHRNEDYKKFNQMIEVNNVGEIVCSNFDAYKNEVEFTPIKTNVVDENENLVEVDTGYDVKCTTNENNKYIFEICERDETVPILTIEITDGKITSWK